jgi:nucleoside-diphosphate-sugar epimerase
VLIVHVLVTGGAGYIGSTTVPLLLDRGHQVRVLDLPAPTATIGRGGASFVIGHLGLASCVDRPGFELLHGDVRDPDALAAALHGVDCVVHLAAVVGQPACDADPGLAESVNVEGTRALLRARHLGQRIVLASTTSVYGRVPSGVCDEDTRPAPVSIYGQTKAVAEQLALRAGNVTVLRFATAFGAAPITRLDLLPNDLTAHALTTGRLVVYEPAARRSFLHVYDIARAVVFAVENPTVLNDLVLNVGDTALNLTKAELAHAVARQTGAQVDLTGHGSDPDQRDYHLSFARIRALGFAATVDLEAGIAQLARALGPSGLVPAEPRWRFLPHPAVFATPLPVVPA